MSYRHSKYSRITILIYSSSVQLLCCSIMPFVFVFLLRNFVINIQNMDNIPSAKEIICYYLASSHILMIVYIPTFYQYVYVKHQLFLCVK